MTETTRPTIRVAVLDACVLIPSALSDTLLRAAESDLFRARWSAEILEEVRRTLVVDGMTSAVGAERRVAAMRVAFPHVDVTGYEPLVTQMTNHPKDRHVLAAAVVANAQVIVTENLRDFPEDALAPFSIAAWSPDRFLSDLYQRSPDRMLAIVREQAADLQDPPVTVMQVIQSLQRITPGFSALVLNTITRSQ